MLKYVSFFFLNVFIASLLYRKNLISPYKGNNLQKSNHAPVVKIISPKTNTIFDWNVQVNYTITVSDKEDGESMYEEINPKEVLIKVRYADDVSKISKADDDNPALTAIVKSNCFNCHNFDGRLIGPSFKEIAKRYPFTFPNTGLMVKRIREGSSGVWGKVSMPSHPELTERKIQNMVQWIWKNAGTPNVYYYVGAEGSFRLKKPAGAAQKAGYVLTASYTDHGLKEDSTRSLAGRDIIIIKGR